MIYRIPRKNEIQFVFKNNPAFTYVPEFDALQARDMCFVMLYADPMSPIWYFVDDNDLTDIEHRRHVIKILAYPTSSRSKTERMIKGTVSKIEKAIKVYHKLVPLSRNAIKSYLVYIKNVEAEIEKPFDGDLKRAKEVMALIKGNILGTTRELVDELLQEYQNRYDEFLKEINASNDISKEGSSSEEVANDNSGENRDEDW